MRTTSFEYAAAYRRVVGEGVGACSAAASAAAASTAAVGEGASSPSTAASTAGRREDRSVASELRRTDCGTPPAHTGEQHPRQVPTTCSQGCERLMLCMGEGMVQL